MNPTTENTLAVFKNEILPLCVSAETSNNAATWNKANPLAGHCAIVSLFLHNQTGADIIRCVPLLPDGTNDSHYLNSIEGEWVDLTGAQYDPMRDIGDVVYSEYQPRTADYLLSNESTKKRYGLFEEKALRVMHEKKFSFAL